MRLAFIHFAAGISVAVVIGQFEISRHDGHPNMTLPEVLRKKAGDGQSRCSGCQQISGIAEDKRAPLPSLQSLSVQLHLLREDGMLQPLV